MARIESTLKCVSRAAVITMLCSFCSNAIAFWQDAGTAPRLDESAGTGDVKLSLEDVLARASRVQGNMSNVVGTFQVRRSLPVEAILRSGRELSEEHMYNGGVMEGEMTWYRSQGHERVDTRWAVPSHIRRNEYEDLINIFDEKAKTETEIMTRARKAYTVESDHLRMWGPSYWLFPVFNRDFDRIQKDPRFSITLLRRHENGDVDIRVQFKMGDVPAAQYDARLSRQWDYAVVWAQSRAAGVTSTKHVEYTRDSESRVLPIRADRSVQGEAREVVDQWHLEVTQLSLVEPDPVVFEYLPPNGTLLDNRDGSGYRINERGEKAKVTTILGARTTAAANLGLAGCLAAIALGFGAFRLRLFYMQR
ncbi:MAG: hypothetical protein HUU22_03720 [Phycisphaerae bacterium]|nr:hypothetical protein [Phycisphaerae bacterium]NUQ45124.1 hypothetical protein [Phycisphaerae bacterium]